MKPDNQQGNNDLHLFTRKVWITASIVALMVTVLLLFRATFSVLLLILAGTLIAVFFRGTAELLQRKTKWKEGICLTLAVAGTFILLILLFWLMGSKVQAQAAQLSDTLPKTIQHAREELNKSQLGQKIIQKISSSETEQQAGSVAKTFFRGTFGMLGDLYVVLFIGLFFTVSPGVYKNGILRLVPVKGKEKANGILVKTGDYLKKWLKGKLFAMLVVFVLTAIGLAIIGVPMWLVLALIAGMLNFIPNFGPLIALIPAVLVALMQGPATAAWVAGLYIFVQVAESNFITPIVQQKLISIPPALIIIAQLLIAPLTGGWGLLLATPLLIIIIVLVQELYVKRQEGG